MRIAVFSIQPYDARYLEKASAGAHELAFFGAVERRPRISPPRRLP